VIALYRILLRTSVTRGRLLAFLAAGGLLDLVAYSIRTSDYAHRETDLVQLLDAGLTIYVPVVALVFATSVLGDLASDGTLVYIWLRPIARWRIVLVALAATLTVTLPLTLLPIGLALVLGGASGKLAWAACSASALAVAAYAAVFIGFGLRVRLALIFGLVYVLVWEAGIASFGGGPAALSIRHYAESLGGKLSNQPVPHSVEMWPAVFTLVGIIVAATAVSSVLLARQDVA
jgi:ABC-2 type transport system permease protein